MANFKPLDSLKQLTSSTVQSAQDAQDQVKAYAYSTLIMEALTLAGVAFLIYKITGRKK